MPPNEDNSHYEKLPNGEVRCIDSEIPFEIPENWCWVRLGNLFSHSSGKALNGGDKGGKPYQYITTSNLYWNRFELDNLRTMNFRESELEKCTATKGDLLVCEGGDIGRAAIWNYDYDIKIQNHIHKLRAFYPLCTKFFYYIFFLYKHIGFIGGKGIGIQGLSSGALHQIILPIAPLNEQMRIVEKIDKIMPIADKYAQTQQELDNLNSEIYDLLKKSILQEAIQGRLVPQYPTDEPATKLLERIRVEKQKLVKEGKLKAKDITDSIIYKGDDNKYYEQIGGKAIELDSDFEFPNTWSVVRLSDICRLIDGEKKQGQYVCLDAKYLRGKSTGDKLNNGKFVSKGDNIILVDGENSGEVFTVPCDGYMGSTFKQLWVSKEIYLPYVLYFIQFYKDRLRNSKKGAAIPHLNKDIFYNLFIGIPPKDEQIRISAKVAYIYDNL